MHGGFPNRIIPFWRVQKLGDNVERDTATAEFDYYDNEVWRWNGVPE